MKSSAQATRALAQRLPSSYAATASTPQPLRIGPLALDTPVLGAPIAGFTDAIFRRIVRDLGGCGLVFTEMIGAGPWMQALRGCRRRRPERISMG